MESFELEPATGVQPVADRRPRINELPPVRLIVVEDPRLPTPPGKQELLDAFYIDLWELQRDAPSDADPVYRAENARLRFYVIADPLPVQRETVRPLGIEVRSLKLAQRKLIEAEIEFIPQRGLVPGQDSLLVLDPAGNWVELFESRPV